MALPPRNIEAAELIAELPAWNDGSGIDAESWVGCVGSFELAIGYSLVFWPSFARIGQYVVVASVDEAAIKSWEDTGKYSRREIEAVLNHIHIDDLHGGDSPPSEAQARFIGRTLKSIYEVKLASEFPDTVFEVMFNDEPLLDIIDYQLTFWQAEPCED